MSEVATSLIRASHSKCSISFHTLQKDRGKCSRQELNADVYPSFTLDLPRLGRKSRFLVVLTGLTPLLFATSIALGANEDLAVELTTRSIVQFGPELQIYTFSKLVEGKQISAHEHVKPGISWRYMRESLPNQPGLGFQATLVANVGGEQAANPLHVDAIAAFVGPHFQISDGSAIFLGGGIAYHSYRYEFTGVDCVDASVTSGQPICIGVGDATTLAISGQVIVPGGAIGIQAGADRDGGTFLLLQAALNVGNLLASSD